MKIQNQLMLLIVFVVLVIVLTALVKTFWNLTAMLGVIMIFASLYLMIVNRGKITVSVKQPWSWFFVIGMIFLMLSLAGVEIMVFEHPLAGILDL